MSVPQAPFDFLSKQSQVSKISAPKGAVICQVGDLCSQLIILQKGRVRVYKPSEDGRAITLYHVTPGESCILTASCLLNTQRFPAIAEVEEAAEGLAVPMAKMQEWLREESVWQEYIFALLSQRMSSLIFLVDALAFSNLNSRLAHWLLKLEQTTIKTTHQIIAEELGSSREVISRLLKDLENDELVKLGRGVIEIIDVKRLEQACL